MLARLRAGAAVLLLFLLFAPAASADDYIVVLKGGDPNAAATKQRVQPKQVYKAAVDGYSATMSPAQAARIAADSSVAGVYADRRFQGLHPEGLTHNPFIRTGDQLVPGSVRRVGAESSPTAHIDGVDQRVDADVAVIDTGIGVHSDLNVVGSHNCNTGTDTDVDGHGTMVSGSLAAIDDMRDSIVGVAPGARLWSLKVFDDQGNAEFSNVICAVDWVTAHAKTVDVANMSLGDFGADDGNCGYTNGDILHQAICRSVAAGVTYVAAAGNESEDASRIIPASYDEVITVSSFADYNGTKKKNDGTNNCGAPAPDEAFSEFSNFGADIDIAAPGECDTTDYPNQMFAFGSGTSSAAPHVSGAAALLKAGHPAWTPAQVKAAIVGNEEHSSLPGDPDHFNEGIVNVAGF